MLYTCHQCIHHHIHPCYPSMHPSPPCHAMLCLSSACHIIPGFRAPSPSLPLSFTSLPPPPYPSSSLPFSSPLGIHHRPRPLHCAKAEKDRHTRERLRRAAAREAQIDGARAATRAVERRSARLEATLAVLAYTQVIVASAGDDD